MTAAGPDGPGTDPVILRIPQDRLAWFTDGGECAAHDAFSGRTHLLDPAASLVFTLLAERPMATGALAAALAERWQVPAEALDQAALARILRALEEAGLIEKAPP